MPPLARPAAVASVDGWRMLFEPRDLFSTVSLLCLFATVLRSIALHIGNRKRSVSRAHTDLEHSTMDQDELMLKQRKDSSQGGQVHLRPAKEASPVGESKKQPSQETQEDSEVHPSSLEQKPNDYLESLKQETRQPSLSPIYPWVAPPQRLPGPYDAPYYPLPLPTIALQKTHETEGQTTPKTTEDEKPEELETIVFSRRVPTSNSTEAGAVREEVVTVSNKGWRRTQWTVNTGLNRRHLPQSHRYRTTKKEEDR